MPRRTIKNRNIEVILLQDDKHLGEKYEIVAVKPIFARNVLLPQNIAVLADRAKKAAGLEDLFAKMAENGGVELTRKVNKDNVLYAKVHESDIAEAIKEVYGVEIDSHLLKLKKKINEAGTYVVPFLYKDMKKEVTVVVMAEFEAKVEEKKAATTEVVVEKTKEELKAEREAKKAAEKAEKIAKLKEKYK